MTRRVETCRACRTERRDMLITTSATCTTRVQGCRHSVDWGEHVHLTFFPEVVPEIDANPEHKRLNMYMHDASTTASSSSAMLVQTRLNTLNTSCVSCRGRAKWNVGLSLSPADTGQTVYQRPYFYTSIYRPSHLAIAQD